MERVEKKEKNKSRCCVYRWFKDEHYFKCDGFENSWHFYHLKLLDVFIFGCDLVGSKIVDVLRFQ